MLAVVRAFATTGFATQSFATKGFAFTGSAARCLATKRLLLFVGYFHPHIHFYFNKCQFTLQTKHT